MLCTLQGVSAFWAQISVVPHFEMELIEQKGLLDIPFGHWNVEEVDCLSDQSLREEKRPEAKPPCISTLCRRAESMCSHQELKQRLFPPKN
jgi:hypothetical protein